MKKIYNTIAFTLVELVVSIVITVTLLGGVLYFITDVLVSLTESQSRAQFIWEFNRFIETVKDNEVYALVDNAELLWSDVLILNDISRNGLSNWYYIVGAVDLETRTLNGAWSIGIYSNRVLGYKYFDKNYIDTIANPLDIYTDTFSNDELFGFVNIKNIQLKQYSSLNWNFNEIEIEIFPDFQEHLVGENWDSINQDDIFKYYVSLPQD